MMRYVIFLLEHGSIILSKNKLGWKQLSESSALLFPLLLRASCALKGVVVLRTFHVDVSAKELNVLIMRIAMKQPVLALREATRCIKAYAAVPRVQAHLLSIISDIVCPIIKKEEDFLIKIEKDPLQEDYLQGRMLGNPYKSSDPGMGPLMRDIKNKICRDCELIALLDDDTGMEASEHDLTWLCKFQLLVNQQIIALDLPVSGVYENLWRPNHPDQPMTIIYRMRGLLGDATESFVKTLADSNSKEKIDDKQLRLAAALGAPVGAFPAILSALDEIGLTGGSVVLLKELHRLLICCVKVESNRRQLNECGGIRKFLHVVEVIYKSGVKDDISESITLLYLDLTKKLLADVLATDEIEKHVSATFSPSKLLGILPRDWLSVLSESSLFPVACKEKIDDKQLRLAAALGAPVGAFPAILSALDEIGLTGGSVVLLKELHRLLICCVKVESNRRQLNECGGIRKFLHVVEVIYKSGVKDDIAESITLLYLDLTKKLLADVLATDEIEKSIGGATFEQMQWLLELSMGKDEGLPTPILEAITSIAPNLCLGNMESMDALVETFTPCCQWNQIDSDQEFCERVAKKVETLCKITAAIHNSASGRLLKMKMMNAGLISGACQYLAVNHPPLFQVSVTGPEWKHFLTKPSLKYVLRLMAGMARDHQPSQQAIAENSLPILHRLEQISTFAFKQIEKVRQETKAKKRQLAMAMRQKQLSEMGMEIGKKGQVKVSSRRIVNEPHTVQSTSEVGACCICREEVDAGEKIMM
ncbi:unnamed protein product [Gongylonema pulchrum]|uniref:FANCI_S4 domain-containing protein n=1 Tax=Gongylonema pulchrum TaxID=637853 RepID=A0A183DX09_9BILA|nr:unnamed protein product [Gongylonema pulchrum]